MLFTTSPATTATLWATLCALQINAGLVRVLGMLDPVEAMMKPTLLLRFLAHKTLQHTPGETGGCNQAA